jgi:signal-transduction protein with cAMP-binding, CBS, and nucleotidyltransferase domain
VNHEVNCPQCNRSNIEGSTECENCGTDISHLWKTKTKNRYRDRLGRAIAEEELTNVGDDRSIALKVSPEIGIRQVVKLMRENRKCSVVVVGEADTVEGIFTERSLVVRVCNESPIDIDKPIKEAMLKHPVILEKSDSVAHALHHMYLGDYTYAIIRDDPMRVVNIRDILTYFVEHSSHNGFT